MKGEVRLQHAAAGVLGLGQGRIGQESSDKPLP